ncbi:MAG: AraC family transcriptional regulator, partial [Ruminococcus flavefaciens]|nr:AraC family transcriptional regulator [Ruminococcus flavefaciens]
EDREEVSGYYEDDSLTLGIFRLFKEKKYNITQEDAVFSLTLRHMTEEFMQANGYLLDTMVRYSADCFMMVIKNDTGERENLRRCMKELIRNIESELHIVSCIYMGKMSRMERVREQMQTLLCMVRGVPDDQGLLFEEEWRGRGILYEPPDFSAWEQSMMHPQDMAEVFGRIIDYVTELWESGRANVTVFGCFKADLQQMVFHYMMENGILMNQIFEAGEYEWYCDKAALTLRNMKEFINVLFKKLEAVKNVESTEQNVVEQIVHYIDDNLAGDLSRAKLAAIAYISEDYLSKKFASHTGMSIPNYISARRMEKAREYFKNTNRSVSEVASLVGYTNFSYFSKTFRDYAGCTPNEYKNRYK